MTKHSAPVFALVFLVLLPLGACRSGSPSANAAPGRVVVISYDGVGADLAWGWLEGGVLPGDGGLAGMVEKGTAARRVRMVNPTLTAVNHISLATGALPEATGIVCNRFHPAGTPIGRSVSGFVAPIGAETLWQAARRQGKRVGVLTWPGADGTSEARKGDFGLIWVERGIARSEILELEPQDATSFGAIPSSDGVAGLAWTVTVPLEGAEPARTAFEVAVFDGTPDGVSVYDTVAVRSGDAGWEVLGRDPWFPVEVRARARKEDRPHRWGAWCKVLHESLHDGRLRLYRGGVYRVKGYPQAFEDAISEQVGFWPGPPETHRLGEWWRDQNRGLDLETVLEQIERFDRYLDRVAEWTVAHERFDLLMAYHPTPDEYEHAGLITDRRQWGWSKGTELAAREGLDRVGRSFDASVAAMWRMLDPGKDVLAVVSDHGLMPIWDMVNVNQALADAGLLDPVERKGRLRPSPESRVVAYVSGGCAHLYLNLKGREPGGVVDPARREAVLQRAARAMADLTADGVPVVERIVRREEAGPLGLDSPNSGDLIVFLQPGFAVSGRLGRKVVEPAPYYGQHGYLNTHDALCGIFFARGAGVPRRRIEETRATDLAPRVAAWLGIEPPRH